MSFNITKTSDWTCLIWKSKDKKFFCIEDFEAELTVSNVRTVISLILSLGKQLNTQLYNYEKNLTKQYSEIFIEKWPIKLTLVEFQLDHDFNIEAYYLKLEHKWKIYFIKHFKKANVLWSGWYIEAEATKDAEKILSGLEWVKVIKFKFWYTDKKSRCYISEWFSWKENCESLEDYLKNLDKIIESIDKNLEFSDETNKEVMDLFKLQKNDLELKKTELENKFTILKNKLTGFFDFHKHNIFIDKDTWILYLFDLSKLEF